MAIINKNSITFNDTKPFNGLAVNAPLVVDKGADGSFAVAAHQIYWGNTYFNGSYLTTGTTQDLLTSIEAACAGINPDDVNDIIREYLDNNGVSIPEEYVTQSEINAMAYITANDVKNNIPAEYITETELNNKKFLTAIPAEYITETELAAKKYITLDEVPSQEIVASDLWENF